MWIDGRVEPLVRENLAAVVTGDPQRAVAATQAMVDRGPETYADAVSLCYAVDNQVLVDLHDGPPAPESIAHLADSVAVMEAWTNIARPSAETFMTALVREQDPASVLPPNEAVHTGFVLGGWLLSAFLPMNMRWEKVLDETLTKVRRGPGPLIGQVGNGVWTPRL